MTDSGETDAGRLMQLYKDLAAKEGTKGKTLADMTPDELRAYKSESKRRSRERQRAAMDKGSPEPTTDNIRSVLADAALLILIKDAPGADIVMGVLGIAFKGRAGVPGKVRADAKDGKIRLRNVRDLASAEK
ncbi:hypothetical protein [Microvirga calopogonii]|uniref:hypothetical protein n=1 Tax=Microvirga calopogonii TaxID=2078013 RepID=UPI000E0D1138|nr:hypothetical protein [Microvirga calopogonii]